jgi:DNA-binding NarL/FixJ family response regulator
MGSISVLKRLIESLRGGLPASEVDRIRREMLSIVEILESRDAYGGNGNGNGNGHGDFALHGRLSRREKEVMSMMLEGQRLKEIAARLNISVKTVTTHRSRLMKKLQVEDNLGLYRYGIRAGLISV